MVTRDRQFASAALAHEPANYTYDYIYSQTPAVSTRAPGTCEPLLADGLLRASSLAVPRRARYRRRRSRSTSSCTT